ncbi:MAG TPA: DNA/RNA nuclease SfsA [Anaerolineae bacterium]|nr:DNA/RNA nuclease SfsA [Anaerolineae bacterium]
MKHPQPLIPARFLRRDNRFRATVEVNGREAWAHVPNSGRLDDLFVPGRPIFLHPVDNPNRKTPYDLKLVQLPEALVSIDARLPNPIFAEAVAAGKLPEFPCHGIQPEVRYGDSRLDFRLEGPEGVCWVETKSVTLVEAGVAYFPDVPTARGSRHLRELLDILERGERAAVVFIIQRGDAVAFAPAAAVDPLFAQTLAQVAAAGVEVRAYVCRVDLEEIVLDHPVPVRLG